MDDKRMDQALEALLQNQSPPGDEITQAVTPWQRAMGRILWGSALQCITFQFFGLQYFLPTLGALLWLLGFRTLRRENRWWRCGWVLASVREAEIMVWLVWNSAAARPEIPGGGTVFTVANLLLVLIQLFCLWRGLAALGQKVDLSAGAGSGAALFFWYLLVCLLALLGIGGGWILGLFLLALYALILRSLYRLSQSLEEAGYAVTAAPVRISDRALAAILTGIVVVGMAVGYLFFSQYPMDWQPKEASLSAEAMDVRDHLAELGFPEAILEDLAEEDILRCEGALRVVTDVHTHTLDDRGELCITGVGVELPGERERWQIFHHFVWTKSTGFWGTESIQLWPAYHLDGWGKDGEATGRLLYDLGGSTYTAPYYFLGEKTFTSFNLFYGDSTTTDLFAAFSLPRKGEAQRGYVTYTTKEMQDGCIIDSWCNYTHQMGWFQYPVRTAMEMRMINGWNHAGVFFTEQDALQFFPNAEVLKPLGE